MKNLACITVMSLFMAICSHATAQEAPVIVNPQTGAVVNLTRAYWDANVDIANKSMQCDYYSFDTETSVFEKSSRDRSGRPLYSWENAYIYNTRYLHPPLPNEIAPVNIADILYEGPGELISPLSTLPGVPFWTVSDGEYLGPAALTASEFVEIVAFNASTDNAVRVWFEDESVPAYSVCYDLDGTPLLPTGTVGSGNTQLVDFPDFTFDFPDAYESIPEIINQETGESVQFMRGRWSFNKHLAGKTISCNPYRWRNYPNDRPDYYDPTIESKSVNANGPYDGGENIRTGFNFLSDLSSSYFFDLYDTPVSSIDRLPGGSDGYMETIENGYRIWQSSDSYNECYVSGGLSVTELLPLMADDSLVVTGNCDYTNADDFDGWGWNQIAQQSCPPLEPVADDCDYSAANQYGGWGWDATLGESCPPLNTNQPDSNPTELSCVDPDGDGWGWNGTSSCRVEVSTVAPITPTPAGNCDYSNAAMFSGWGWDAVAGSSCAPLETAPVDNCDYSNASMFGGWGWDAVAGSSCAPIETTPVDNCDYSNASMFSGWGWDPVAGRSCEP